MTPQQLELMITTSSMPEPGKKLLIRLLARDRDFRIVLSVEAYRRAGYGLHNEPGGAYDMVAVDHSLSISSVKRIYSKDRAIIQNLV